MAGHDINYLAVSGVLSQLGRKDGLPYPPANILADFAGGGLMCAFGILLALVERSRSGKGQVVQNNMVDGSAYLASMLRYGLKSPLWNQPRGHNLLDGGCPWYDVYECKDGGYMAVGALEPKFFQALLHGLDLDLQSDTPLLDPMQIPRNHWPLLASKFKAQFLSKTRAEWEAIFDRTDACCTPVITQHELEASDYDQRLPVGLNGGAASSLQANQGWESRGLAPGVGGEELLKEWMGWKRGREYEVRSGGLVRVGNNRIGNEATFLPPLSKL